MVVAEFSPQELQHTIEIHKVVVRDLSSGNAHNNDEQWHSISTDGDSASWPACNIL
jgi:hypothetical protein